MRSKYSIEKQGDIILLEKFNIYTIYKKITVLRRERRIFDLVNSIILLISMLINLAKFQDQKEKKIMFTKSAHVKKIKASSFVMFSPRVIQNTPIKIVITRTLKEMESHLCTERKNCLL